MAHLTLNQTDYLTGFQTSFQNFRTRAKEAGQFTAFCQLNQNSFYRHGIPLETLDRITLAAHSLELLGSQVKQWKERALSFFSSEKAKIAEAKTYLQSTKSQDLDLWVEVEKMERYSDCLEEQASQFESLDLWVNQEKSLLSQLENLPSDKKERRRRLGLPIETQEASAFFGSREKDQRVLRSFENDLAWTSENFQKFAKNYLDFEIADRCPSTRKKHKDSRFEEDAGLHRWISLTVEQLDLKNKALKRRMAALTQLETHLTHLSNGQSVKPLDLSDFSQQLKEEREMQTLLPNTSSLFELFREIDQAMGCKVEQFEHLARHLEERHLPFSYLSPEQILEREKKQTELFKTELDSFEQKYNDLLLWAQKRKRDLEAVYPELKKREFKPSEPFTRRKDLTDFSVDLSSSPSRLQKIKNVFSSFFSWKSSVSEPVESNVPLAPEPPPIPKSNVKNTVRKFEKKRSFRISISYKEAAIGAVCVLAYEWFRRTFNL